MASDSSELSIAGFSPVQPVSAAINVYGVSAEAFAGQLLLTSKKELVEEFGFDLLIDEDTVVRSTTIRAMASLKVPGWVNVMKRSLLDDDYVIQRAAMDGLLSDRAEGVQALKKFVSENPKNRISSMAVSQLLARGIQP